MLDLKSPFELINEILGLDAREEGAEVVGSRLDVISAAVSKVVQEVIAGQSDEERTIIPNQHVPAERPQTNHDLAVRAIRSSEAIQAADTHEYALEDAGDNTVLATDKTDLGAARAYIDSIFDANEAKPDA